MALSLKEAIQKAFDELEAARKEPSTSIKLFTQEIFDSLDTSPVADALAHALFMAMADTVTRRPEMINIAARTYLATCLWIGRRAKELMDAPAKKQTNGQTDGHAS
jgi:hypothetical protein